MHSRPAPPWRGQVRWTLWGLWVASIALMVLQVSGYRRVEPLHGIAGGISLLTPGSYVIDLLVTGLGLGTTALAGRRGFCHARCWMALFLILGQRLGALLRLLRRQLRTDSAHGTGCQTCTRNCPMSLPVHTLVARERLASDAGVLCGICVDGCKHGVIAFACSAPSSTTRCQGTPGARKGPAHAK